MTVPVRVFLVDDHPVVRDGLRATFEGGGMHVVGEAASGPEAVALLAALVGEVDVVLMDLRMPGGDGVAAVRSLRSRADAPRVLVLTTYDTDGDIRAAMQAGADGYLLKDTRSADLVRAVQDVARGTPVLAPRALRALSGRDRAPAERLTPRETEVLTVVARGGTNKAAADRLFVSEATVKTHLLRVYAKLGVTDRTAAVRVAHEQGLI